MSKPTNNRATGKFKSKFEARLSEQMKKAKVRHEYETVEIEYDLDVYRGFCNDCGSDDVLTRRVYVVDFFLPDHGFYIEAKGLFTPKDRAKMKQVKKDHPDLDIRIVLLQNKKLTKRSKTRYTDWCENNNFQYAVGEIPNDWFQK